MSMLRDLVQLDKIDKTTQLAKVFLHMKHLLGNILKILHMMSSWIYVVTFHLASSAEDILNPKQKPLDT